MVTPVPIGRPEKKRALHRNRSAHRKLELHAQQLVGEDGWESQIIATNVQVSRPSKPTVQPWVGSDGDETLLVTSNVIEAPAHRSDWKQPFGKRFRNAVQNEDAATSRRSGCRVALFSN